MCSTTHFKPNYPSLINVTLISLLSDPPSLPSNLPGQRPSPLNSLPLSQAPHFFGEKLDVDWATYHSQIRLALLAISYRGVFDGPLCRKYCDFKVNSELCVGRR